jgi:hypothetical protein
MPDLKRSEQCKRAWDTIRANRAARAAGLPVAAPASSRPPKPSLLPKIAAWLEPVPEPIPVVQEQEGYAPISTIERVKPAKVRRVKVARASKQRGKRSKAA